MVMRGIIFAAGKSSRLGSLTKELPKICLEIDSENTILDRNLKLLSEHGITELIIVTGHAEEKIKEAIKKHEENFHSIQLLYNDHYYDRNNVYTAYLVKDKIDPYTIIFNSDIVYDPGILDNAIKKAQSSLKSFLVVDDSKKLIDEDMKVLLNSNNEIIRINKNLDNNGSVGEYIGILRLTGEDIKKFAKSLEEMIEAEDFDKYYEDALDRISSDLNLELVSTDAKLWTEIDFPEDYQRAKKIVAELNKVKV